MWIGEARAKLCPAPPFARFACMPPLASEQLSRTIEILYRSESGWVLATLMHLLGDPNLAEESMHEAFAAALESWPRFLCHGQTGDYLPTYYHKPVEHILSIRMVAWFAEMAEKERFFGCGGLQRLEFTRNSVQSLLGSVASNTSAMTEVYLIVTH